MTPQIGEIWTPSPPTGNGGGNYLLLEKIQQSGEQAYVDRFICLYLETGEIGRHSVTQRFWKKVV